jgi:hypothetical protein
MAQRGRPKKIKQEPTVSDTQVELTMLKVGRQEEIEQLYKDLARVKRYLNSALWQVGVIDSCENFAEAAFKAGRAYGPLDSANDRLADILDRIREQNDDLEHWDDIYDEN